MWYTYWLACVEGITGDRKCELCRKNGSAEAVYYIEEKGIREQIITEKEWGILKESKKKRNWREAYQKVVDRGIQMAVRGQNNYPKRFEELAGIRDPLFSFLSGRCHGRKCRRWQWWVPEDVAAMVRK